MGKKNVPSGSYDYITTDDGILVLRWKDNKVVTMVSTDLGLKPIMKCMRYCKDTKMKTEVTCPSVIKSYNANMGGIDKSDMLVHLYKTPMKSKRWYMRLFAYTIDLCLTNAWLSYKRDCNSLNQSGLCLKDFRLDVFRLACNRKPAINRSLRNSPTSLNIPPPLRGHRSPTPDALVRFDQGLFHAPLVGKRQTWKNCSRKGGVVRTNILCRICKVHLCLNAERNCFLKYHEAVA